MAVYTEFPEDELIAFVADYDIGKVISCKGIAEGVENSNYLLQTTVDTYILTLYEKRVDREDLPFFLNLLDHLAAAGIACPTPIHGRDSITLRELAGRPAAIVSFLTGLWVRKPHPVHCSQLGQSMAKMHLAGRDFALQRKNMLSVKGWSPLVEACLERADEISPNLSKQLMEELSTLSSNWPEGLPAGIIHADLFPDNVFFVGENLSGFIDFYFACNDFLSYDLAICLNAWCFEPDLAFNITKARALLSSYSSIRSLSKEELDSLPILARGASFRFLLTRLYDRLNHVEGAFVQPKDPLEYLRKLIFHQSVTSPSAYGFETEEYSK